MWIESELNELGQADVVPAARRESGGLSRGAFRERHRKQYRLLDARWFERRRSRRLSSEDEAGSIPAQTSKGSSMERAHG
jgi:hypothetical protein